MPPGNAIWSKVTHIAFEAVEEQEAKRDLADAPAAANMAGAPASQAGQPQSFVFPVTIALDEQAMNINGAMVPLTSGMTVTVEIKTDWYRVIDYLLSPLTKITPGSFQGEMTCAHSAGRTAEFRVRRGYPSSDGLSTFI